MAPRLRRRLDYAVLVCRVGSIRWRDAARRFWPVLLSVAGPAIVLRPLSGHPVFRLGGDGPPRAASFIPRDTNSGLLDVTAAYNDVPVRVAAVCRCLRPCLAQPRAAVPRPSDHQGHAGPAVVERALATIGTVMRMDRRMTAV
jgi:hypothetical protein